MEPTQWRNGPCLLCWRLYICSWQNPQIYIPCAPSPHLSHDDNHWWTVSATYPIQIQIKVQTPEQDHQLLKPETACQVCFSICSLSLCYGEACPFRGCDLVGAHPSWNHLHTNEWFLGTFIRSPRSPRLKARLGSVLTYWPYIIRQGHDGLHCTKVVTIQRWECSRSQNSCC